MSVQASVSGGTPGTIELLPTFVDGLQDLDGSCHPRTGWYADRLDRLGDARSDRRFG
jgi:tRNA (Thr-GGU) A37 N-methylase